MHMSDHFTYNLYSEMPKYSTDSEFEEACSQSELYGNASTCLIVMVLKTLSEVLN
jgi:hypothetical protein